MSSGLKPTFVIRMPPVMSCLCFNFSFTLTSGAAAIAADHRGQVKQFPNVKAYDDYYDIIVDIGEIGVESFADRAQALLIVYLRDTYGDGPADWCQEFWTGDRGRMCLAHARYSGSNNNMGVEVSWKLIKEICSYLVGLSTFIGALCKFIRNQLGDEHMYRMMRDGGHSNHFIREPQETREMYDAVQAMHPKTLSACFIVATSTSKRDPELIFDESCGNDYVCCSVQSESAGPCGPGHGDGV